MISNIHLFDEVLPLGKLHKVAVRVPARVLHPRLVPRGPVAEALAAVETTHVVAQLWGGVGTFVVVLFIVRKEYFIGFFFVMHLVAQLWGGG